MDTRNWQGRAACRHADPDLFHLRDREPADPIPDRITHAERTYCRHCPVWTDCRADANQNHDIGLRASTLRYSHRSAAGGGYTTIPVPRRHGLQVRHPSPVSCPACARPTKAPWGALWPHNDPTTRQPCPQSGALLEDLENAS